MARFIPKNTGEVSRQETSLQNKAGIRIETTCAVYQSNSRWRMVQGAVREAKTKHATAHTIATEKQGDEIINN